MARRRNKSEERDIAEARIGRLLSLAREAAKAEPGRADRYAGLALRVAQRYQTGLPAAAKREACRKCGAYRTSATSRTRLRAGRVSVTCLRCGTVRRRPLGIRQGSKGSKESPA